MVGRRRREAVVARWRLLVRISLLWAALTAIGTAIALVIANHDVAIFFLGASVGMYFVLALTITDIIDPHVRRLESAADAEEWTARELRKLERDGWRTVHNLCFAAGDVDHIAIGPGGVVVVETKSTDSDWDFLRKQGVPARWAEQVSTAAFRTAHLVRQRAHTSVEPVALVALWAHRPPEEPVEVKSGVTLIRGKRIRDHILTLERHLDPGDVERIYEALTIATAQFDVARGDLPSGRLRRFAGR